jgi:hypothetical protein
MKKIAFICCLFSLALPIFTILHTFYFNSDSLTLGMFWLLLGNHFLLIPLFIVTRVKFVTELYNKLYLLPLTTWLLLLINLLIYLFFLRPYSNISFTKYEESFLLLCLFLLLSMVIIILIYMKFNNRFNKNEKVSNN